MPALPDRVRLVIFDLDGVVYRGHEPIAGARELIGALHTSGVAVRFATNNSMVARDAKLGLATMCIGIGQGIATIFERV